MEAKNNKVMSDGYNYEKALAQMNWTQDDVNSLRDLVKDFSVVPKSIHDKQVKNNNE